MDNIEQINEDLKRIQTELVRQVLDGEKTENRIPHARPACIQDILTELTGNYVELEDWDVNGYSWDYWTNTEINGKHYVLTGDGYYNKSCNFRLK
jgi:hypothetical protein